MAPQTSSTNASNETNLFMRLLQRLADDELKTTR
jgi:hypothetical protein